MGDRPAPSGFDLFVSLLIAALLGVSVCAWAQLYCAWQGYTPLDRGQLGTLWAGCFGAYAFAQWGGRALLFGVVNLFQAAEAIRLTFVAGVLATDDDAPAESQPAPVDTVAALDAAQRRRQQVVAHWQVYYRRLVQAAAAYGWAIRTLTDKASPYRVTTPDGWNAATDMLVAAGYMVKDNSGSRLTVSLAEWESGQLWQRVPCPTFEPPDIAPPPYRTAHTTPDSTENTEKHRAGGLLPVGRDEDD